MNYDQLIISHFILTHALSLIYSSFTLIQTNNESSRDDSITQQVKVRTDSIASTSVVTTNSLSLPSDDQMSNDDHGDIDSSVGMMIAARNMLNVCERDQLVGVEVLLVDTLIPTTDTTSNASTSYHCANRDISNSPTSSVPIEVDHSVNQHEDTSTHHRNDGSNQHHADTSLSHHVAESSSPSIDSPSLPHRPSAEVESSQPVSESSSSGVHDSDRSVEKANSIPNGVELNPSGSNPISSPNDSLHRDDQVEMKYDEEKKIENESKSDDSDEKKEDEEKKKDEESNGNHHHPSPPMMNTDDDRSSLNEPSTSSSIDQSVSSASLLTSSSTSNSIELFCSPSSLLIAMNHHLGELLNPLLEESKSIESSKKSIEAEMNQRLDEVRLRHDSNQCKIDEEKKSHFTQWRHRASYICCDQRNHQCMNESVYQCVNWIQQQQQQCRMSSCQQCYQLSVRLDGQHQCNQCQFISPNRFFINN